MKHLKPKKKRERPPVPDNSFGRSAVEYAIPELAGERRLAHLPQDWIEQAEHNQQRRLTETGVAVEPNRFIPGYATRVFFPYNRERVLQHIRDLDARPVFQHPEHADTTMIKATSRIGERAWAHDKERIMHSIADDLDRNPIIAHYLNELFERVLAGDMHVFPGTHEEWDRGVPAFEWLTERFFPNHRASDALFDTFHGAELALADHKENPAEGKFGTFTESLRAVLATLDEVWLTNLNALDRTNPVYAELFRDRLRGLSDRQRIAFPDLFSHGYAKLEGRRKFPQDTWSSKNGFGALGNTPDVPLYHRRTYTNMAALEARDLHDDLGAVVKLARTLNLLRQEVRIPLREGESWQTRGSEVERFLRTGIEQTQQEYDALRDRPATAIHRMLRLDPLDWGDQTSQALTDYE